MQNKTLAYWIVGIVGAVLIIVLVIQIRGQNQPASNNTNSNSANAALSNGQEASSTPSAPTATNGKSVPSNSAYMAALAIYQKNGYRVQFSDCHGIPGKLTVTQGQKYMLDNRDNQAHTIKIDSYTYNIPAYGWQILTAQVLGLNNVTCDGGGAAQINIEK
jgi:hypothetical protein